jgi:hypothetical protein
MSHSFNLKIEPKFLELLLVGFFSGKVTKIFSNFIKTFFLINIVILLSHSTDFNFIVEYKDRVLGLKGRCDYIISPNELSIYFIRKIVLSSDPTSDDCVVVALPHRQHNPRKT